MKKSYKKIMPYVFVGAATLAKIFGLTSCGDKPNVVNPFDPCEDVKTEYAGLQSKYKVMEDSCLVYFLPKCMVIPGYKEAYEYNLPGSGPLKAANDVEIQVAAMPGGMESFLTEQEIKNVKGASRTGLAGFDYETAIAGIVAENASCLK